MRTLKTTNDQELIMDDDKYKIASKYQWQSKADGRGGYRPVTYIDGKRIAFSTVVFNIEPNQVIFHKNGNSCDFRKDEIIICDRSELGHLVGSTNRKVSRFKGVYYYQRSNTWAARIIKNNKVIDGGHFSSQEDASIVADYIILQNYGEGAKRNHPDITSQQIEERYNMILDIYGRNSNIKKAKSGQGIIRCKNKTSQYIGVSRDKNKWSARIKYNKKQMHIGNFETEEDAALAYDKKALELYGETAKLNFING